MIVLGLDPGYAITGFGVIDYTDGKFKALEYGAITTPANTPMPERLELLYDDLCYLFEKYSPDAVAVEELFFNTNTKTAISVAQARGVILLAGRKHTGRVAEYTPLQVKQAVVGYGRAEKMQVQQMVKLLLSLTAIPRPDDAADALAVAICHIHSSQMEYIKEKK